MTHCPHCSAEINNTGSMQVCPYCGKGLFSKPSWRSSFAALFKKKNKKSPVVAAPLPSEEAVPKKKWGGKKKKVILIPAEQAIIAPLERFPLWLMIVFTVMTLGLFSVFWFTLKFPQFNKFARRDKQISSWLVSLDLALELIWLTALILSVARLAMANGLSLLLEVIYLQRGEIVMNPAFLALPIGFFLHRHLILWARWNLRSFVARRNRELAKIVAPSWFLLWLFGGIYLQYHINRLHSVHFFIEKEKVQRAVIKIEHS